MSVEPLPTRRPLPPLLMEVKAAAVQKLFARLREQGFDHVREGHGCVFGFIDLENGSRLTELAESAGLTKQAGGEAGGPGPRGRGPGGAPGAPRHNPER